MVITQRLAKLEQERGFYILFACETGSRAWGFASPDSDFDIRFVYAWPEEKYLRLDDPVDNIAWMENDGADLLDFSGWDIRKLLRQVRRSNATVFEWLQSPVIYQEKAGFRDILWALGQAHFNPKAGIHHYLGICHNSIKSGVTDGRIKIKKYFYILRPLLAAMWVADQGTVPPMEFEPLLTQIEKNLPVMNAIRSLMAEKEQAPEGHLIPLVPALQQFIDREMGRCQVVASGLEETKADDALLTDLFRVMIQTEQS